MTKFIQEWDAKGLIAEISGRVLSGMDRACQFAAEQAQARAPKRTHRLEAGITYTIVPEGNEIVGYVGGRRGKAFYEYYQEMGTSKMAAHPHLRPAVFENADEIVRLIAKG